MRDTYLDLWGCVRLPGSSKVHAELEVRHDWHGWPSSHLIRRRLGSGRHCVSNRGEPKPRKLRSPTAVACPTHRASRERPFRGW